ncbi:MAG: site-specific integrase [Chitinophagaceae bacterium]|nr:site-specific integrase [Chitinophagaceae bacterium]
MNTSVKVVLYTSKELSNGEYPVMLRIIKDRKPKYLTTGISCSKELWDAMLCIPKQRHPHHKDAKILIGKKKLEAEKFVYDLENENKNLSSYEIKGKLKKEKISNPSLFEYFDKVISRLIDAGQIKNAEVYKDTRRNLSYFTGLKDIHFSDIDISFLNKFEEFLKSQGKGGNTIYIYLRTLRALLNKAIKEEICSEKFYPFKKFSLSKYSNIKTEKRAISKEEIEKIVAVKVKTANLILAKNLFLFSFYSRGMNFADIAFLKWKDINNDRMTYYRQKTKELFNIELLKPAIKILNFYKPDTYNSRESFVFPIFTESHKTPQTMFNRRVKMLRTVNKNLKTIAKLAELETELTTYVARHSYATILKKKGISTTIISQALGHDSEKTTQIYLESFENNILDEASKVIL